MKKDQILLLLNTLINTDQPMNAGECANLLKMSVSSLKKDIREIKTILNSYGCEIIGKSGNGNGYELIIFDSQLYGKYVNEILPIEIKEDSKDYNEQKNRVHYIIKYLLGTKDYVRSEDLADELAISKSQFSKDLTLVKKHFKNYRIELVNKAHYGIKVQAEELAIRLCLANTYMNNLSFNNENKAYLHLNSEYNDELKKINNIIMESAEQFKYELTDMILQNLMIHLFVAIKRVRNDNRVTIDEETRKQILNEKEKNLAKMIANKIENEFETMFDKEELCYIIMHLTTKRVMNGDDPINDEVMYIVDGMLKRIKEKYCIDLRGNLDLRIVMGLHTLSLIRRIEYKIPLKNPLLGEIKTNLMFEYEIALCACSVINERFNCVISQDEVSYYALHLKVAMDNAREKKKKNILLVCSSGRGSAQLLKFDFLKKFNNQLERIETCNVFQLSKIDLSEYDYIFSTVPVSIHLPIPIFKIKYFLDTDSEKLVDKILQTGEKAQLVEEYFEKELFNGHLKADTKQEVIKIIVDEIGKKKQLPENLLESVMNREKLEDTQLTQLVAFPHPDGVAGNDNIISVNVLEKPIQWGRGNVQVVIFVSFAQGFAKNNDLFFEFISEFIENKYLVNKLITKPTFETLKNIIEDICRKER